MNSNSPSFVPFPGIARLGSLFLVMALFTAPLCAQQTKPSVAREAETKPAPTFDTLLSADSYVVYGEVRNLGQLLSTGGAGEIVDPIMKLAEPPAELKAIVKFLKTNAESLTTSRLLLGISPVRKDIPMVFVAIEFASPEEAARFAPKLDKFLPEILPPVPDATPEAKPPQSKDGKPEELAAQPAKKNETEANVSRPSGPLPNAASKPVEHLPFVITHAGTLVCISNVSFKFEKLHPAGSKPLAEDQNFRIARDRFSTETIFLFFNLALEEKTKPQPQPGQIAVANVEPDGRPKENTDESPDEMPGTSNEVQSNAQLRIMRPAPTPSPTKEQQVQMAASLQMGHLLDFIGRGETEWPEAVGVALNLDNDQYVVRSILVKSPNPKMQLVPFLPQLMSGPALAVGAPSVLPDDTEVFVSTSIDFRQTFDGMKKQAEIAAKTAAKQIPATEKGESLDEFAAFEKKAGFKIKEELLPVLGNEIAVASSLKSLQGLGMFGVPPPPSSKSSSASSQQNNAFPILLIAIKDRDEARRLMPRVLDGMGLGEVNQIAQVEKREDTELVNYGGIFAYAFVGDFVAISDTRVVRHLVDAYVNHQTLASNNAFRNSRRWQPRQTVGEIWVSPALMAGYQDE
ncbi:MAG: hypothetical protein DMF71_04600, partial [Acidobacteria bacterium]